MSNVWKRISILLFIPLLLLSLSIPIFASAGKTETIRLRGDDVSVNSPFQVYNMFPGDMETKIFDVKVNHKKPITLYYHADIRPNSEKLAEVLKVKIQLPDKGVLLYDGLMRDMPSAVEYDLAANEKNLRYEISTYLETSVGNEYQDKTLVADFRWWYLEEDSSSGGDGDDDWSGGSGSTDRDSVSVKLLAEKYMNGAKAKGSKYTFQLTDLNGDVLRSRKNKDELVEFYSLKFTSEGRYNYYLQEKAGDDPNVIYDKSKYKITIVVTEDDDGDLSAKVLYQKDGKAYEGIPRFYNKNEKNMVDTSDTTPIALYVGGLLLSTAALIAPVFKKKKEEDPCHE